MPPESRCGRSRSSQHEAGGTDTADPLGGSFFIEELTDELESRALELIDRVEELGGAVAAVEAGFVQGEIEEAAYRYSQQVETGERIVVGVNRFEEDDGEQIEIHRLDPEIERRQLERTAARARRAECRRGRGRARRGPRRGRRRRQPPAAYARGAAWRCTIGEICKCSARSGARTTPSGPDPQRCGSCSSRRCTRGRPTPTSVFRRPDGARARRPRPRDRARGARPARRREAALPALRRDARAARGLEPDVLYAHFLVPAGLARRSRPARRWSSPRTARTSRTSGRAPASGASPGRSSAAPPQ